MPYLFLGLAVFFNLLCLFANEYLKRYLVHYHYSVWCSFGFPNDEWPLINSHSFTKSGTEKSIKISAGASKYLKFLRSKSYKSLNDPELNLLISRLYIIYLCMVVSIISMLGSAAWKSFFQ